MDTSEFTPVTEQDLEEARGHAATYSKLGERYRSDPDFRSRIDGGDVTEALSELEIDLPPGLEARVVANTDNTFHMVMPPDPNANLADEALSMVAGGCSGGNYYHTQQWMMQMGYCLGYGGPQGGNAGGSGTT